MRGGVRGSESRVDLITLLGSGEPVGHKNGSFVVGEGAQG